MTSGTLKERKKREQEDEAKILRALTCRKKILAEAKRENRRKKKSVSELLTRLTLLYQAFQGSGADDFARAQEVYRTWFVTELCDNKELVNEGRKQKHCVYSYVQRCVEGRSCIFSLRTCRKIAADYDAAGKPIWDKTFETRRVTVEVGASRGVIQVRGPLNRPPTFEEKEVLRRWAGEKGITL